MEMKNTGTLKNGLTPEQVEKARALFKKVNLRACCRKAGVNMMNVYNVLRDESNNIDDFEKVLHVVNREIKRRENKINRLPL